MVIVFTDFAIGQLQGIYDYYAREVSATIALKVTDKILNKIEVLNAFPDSGAIERHVSRLKLNHRCLVCGNYKVIYRKTKETIYVTDIFDTRQDPAKLIKRNRRRKN